MAIGGSKMMMVNGRNMSQRCSNGRLIPKRGQVKLAIAAGMAQSLVQRCSNGRLIPKRGQVKLAIAAGVAHSLASFFSVHRNSRKAAHFPL